MKTHNASIYHCITCGRVVHAEEDAAQPDCCGRTMTRTCSETIAGGGVPGETASNAADMALPPSQRPDNPR